MERITLELNERDFKGGEVFYYKIDDYAILWIVPEIYPELVCYDITGTPYIEFPIIGGKIKRMRLGKYILCPDDDWNVFYICTDDYPHIFNKDADVLRFTHNNQKCFLISTKSPFLVYSLDNPKRLIVNSIYRYYDPLIIEGVTSIRDLEYYLEEIKKETNL
jgi:hypothetical protein